VLRPRSGSVARARVGHQDGDRLTLAEDAGDVVGRAVGVGRVGNVPVGVAVAEEHAVVGDEVGVGLLADLEAPSPCAMGTSITSPSS